MTRESSSGDVREPRGAELEDRVLAERGAVQSWIRRNRDPDQLAIMLRDRTFVDPTGMLLEAANGCVRWSQKLLIVVAQSAPLFDVLVARGVEEVPVLRAALDIASEIAELPVSELYTSDRTTAMHRLGQLRFLTLTLAHARLGESSALRGVIQQHAFLSDSYAAALADAPSRVADEADSQTLRAQVDDALMTRRSVEITFGPYGAPRAMRVPDLLDAFAVIDSPMIRGRDALVIVDALVRIGLGGESPYYGFGGDVSRPETCPTRELLRERSSHAGSEGVLPDHRLLIMRLLARFGPASDMALPVLEHVWRIEPELVVPFVWRPPPIVVPRIRWRYMFQSALLLGDEYSMQLAEQLITEYPGLMPDEADARPFILHMFNHHQEHVRASALRMIECMAMRPISSYEPPADHNEQV